MVGKKHTTLQQGHSQLLDQYVPQQNLYRRLKQADSADQKDSRHLLHIVDRTRTRLSRLNLSLRCVLADAGFSSGENYAALEHRQIEAYIPLFGRYIPVRDPFRYEPEQDQYRCNHGAILRNHGLKMAGEYGNYHYIANFSACQNCPIKEKCCGKRDRKSLSVTMYYREYERMEARLRSAKGKRLKRRRSAVVEPVFGSLPNYFGMRRSSSIGKDSAHKRMVMAATAYNLKKWLLAKRWPKVVTQVLALYPEGSFFAFMGRVTSTAALFLNGLCNSHGRLSERFLLIVIVDVIHCLIAKYESNE